VFKPQDVFVYRFRPFGQKLHRGWVKQVATDFRGQQMILLGDGEGGLTDWVFAHQIEVQTMLKE
jgi:hypothetical protein